MSLVWSRQVVEEGVTGPPRATERELILSTLGTGSKPSRWSLEVERGKSNRGPTTRIRNRRLSLARCPSEVRSRAKDMVSHKGVPQPLASGFSVTP